ncbi:anthranilate synthase component I family protein [Psychroflexus sp. CAK1W]|uniref:anthranilate synthase component I family protein n=1 Tax=Psychroflexus curvus TaxID=2873595 RepID=UPI001CCCC9CF|nr:chorismate-binding protein [Psychroflexus curvus]MBZ9627334.1 anthranilate synthase component I family protein [Psychroflexus curvus]
MSYSLKTTYQKLLADTFTPVSAYLKIRDKYPNSLLLESSDYHANDNSFSYICCNPIAHFKVEQEEIEFKYPDGTFKNIDIDKSINVANELKKYLAEFEVEDHNFKFLTQGLFGFTTYDAVRYFENLTIDKSKSKLGLPDMLYNVFQNVIVINHFNDEAYVFNHAYDGTDRIPELKSLLKNQNYTEYDFELDGKEESPITDEEFMEYVTKAKAHCQRGDVFQMVMSRRFSQGFKGDEFNVYRKLRSINPSPYLFYFDFGNYKIFGSSPEAHLVVQDGKAEIHPIAGTFKRTGNDQEDAAMALKLSEDIKENSEHVMLVDLARNDLSRHGKNVNVETYKEVQYFSHVIHLVSKVTAVVQPEDSLKLLGDTFPAGTLSGAPKHMAMSLIEKYENISREAYGGAIGVIDFKGNMNQAIIIRSFVSKDLKLHFQAGAGVVSDSTEENELQEVINKLGALRKALDQ